jgi:hypothetical protein
MWGIFHFYEVKIGKTFRRSSKKPVCTAINFHFPKFGLRWTSLRVKKPPERNQFLKKIK